MVWHYSEVLVVVDQPLSDGHLLDDNELHPSIGIAEITLLYFPGSGSHTSSARRSDLLFRCEVEDIFSVGMGVSNMITIDGEVLEYDEGLNSAHVQALSSKTYSQRHPDNAPLPP